MSLETAQMPTDGTWRAVTPEGAQAIEQVAAMAAQVLLVSDFDGTLAPIVDDPTQSRPHPAALEAFAGLGRHVAQLAVVTGREVQVCRQLGGFERVPGFEKLVVLGQYGQESWDAATGEVALPPVPEQVTAAHQELEALVASAGPELDGVVLEDKGRAIGVHTRRAADPEGAFVALQAPVARVAQAHGLLLEPGRHVIEVRSSAITKGDAIQSLVDRFSPGVVVMMGDDLGDLAAFARVVELREQGIVGIRVVAGSAEQPDVAAQADVLCDGPSGIAAWLQDLLARVERVRKQG
ncbi:trehalose-phosphatase [Luteococcus sp.]|uniref:trehalose-phosphatase n=1 Tax=Luteococcus sp. TaxID=1969402 RepID=UPI003735483C